MAKKLHYTVLSFFFLFSLLKYSSSLNPDIQPLLAFKSACDQTNSLSNWNSSTNPCTWTGVSCLNNRVSRLVLENLNLKGSFQNLSSLKELRVLSLKNNQFSGPVPNLSKLTALKLLFLSHNEFSGDFPESLTSLFKLYRLDLSYNNFSGEIPANVNRLTHLLTLRLEENDFSGEISGVKLSNLQEFNVSGNKLVGEIPSSLSGFPVSAFLKNRVLCGFPLPKCAVNIPRDPTMAAPVSPKSTVASSPSILPVTTTSAGPKVTRHSSGSKMSSLAIIAIILGDVFVLVVVCLLLYCFFCTRKMSSQKHGSHILEGEKIVYSSSPYPNTDLGQGQTGGFERGKMVFFEGAKRFELEDLLRASAEMLGKGGFGTAYKAVLDDGNVVAVKRLKELNVCGKREFEQQMEVLGRLRHPNLVGLKAYYFARDEKLLVYDFMTNGNLFWLLHGNRGPGRTPLDWTTRLKIAAGAARGLAFIHNSCKSLKLTHGNIKSTNILIDKGGNARVSDFGLAIFATPSSVPKTNGYRAPEVALDGRKITQKSDVYSFGVLLLELLTGKCPSVVDNGGLGTGYGGVVDLPRWVQSVVREEWTAEVFDLELMRYKDIEEEMVGLLQIAMACTAASPDQRPKINYVVKMIEELRGVEVSPSHDTADSVSDSPAVSEDNTCGASQ
ncbi:probable leucine-rich repeat receptor-like protein kinase At1g68400 [Nicotiana tomentosiformis]|uniref:probable leucine-rich repeat receptor-like protein kinase At1g68400 n=1 Tax=Nicotiana tomentosiformis TaxID=4098 RepID=UPI00051C3A59|nr:probable leucine-rich repeat receptor-like protein kinase At1g68400 [Nicotiana tomentosiformis]